MDFFYPNKDYLDFLRNFESKIMQTNGYKFPKFVFGTVFEIQGHSYYIPVSSIKKEIHLNNDGSLKSNYKRTCLPIMISDKETTEKIASLLRFDFMFPIPTSELKRVEIDGIENSDYRNLVQKEYFFCKNNRNKIKEKAFTLYEKAKDPTHYLNSLCCDFALIEVECNNWIKNKKR